MIGPRLRRTMAVFDGHCPHPRLARRLPTLLRAAGLRVQWQGVHTIFNGANPTYSRHLRGLLLQAGFARSEGFAVAADYAGNLDATRHSAAIWVRVLRDPAVAGQVIGQAWAAQAELDELAEGLQRWGERPDAFFAVMYCAALGWTE